MIEDALPFDFIGLGQLNNGQNNQLQGQENADWEPWQDPVQDAAVQQLENVQVEAEAQMDQWNLNLIQAEQNLNLAEQIINEA